jgi:1,4-dihydroxy-2-naphthoate octaprenyltransferase
MALIDRSTIRLLRIPFSFFLSPIYLFALAAIPVISTRNAVVVFLILHFLIYPASNGYNSYMDRDTGPIGGLEHPPEATRQLYLVTIILDILAVLLSLLIDPVFMIAVIIYIAISKAYSYRGIRLKKYPFLGFLVVILFQGAFTFWLVWYGASQEHIILPVPWLGMLVCAMLVGGFYPLTQVYQHQQDLQDGVKTISYVLGVRGTFIFCALLYVCAWFWMAQFFIRKEEGAKLWLAGIFFVPVIVYFTRWFLKILKDEKAANFKNTMRMNWIAATFTNISFLALLIWKLIE